jgi:hypothetical protein
MPFQPFGYHFEINSPLPPSNVKAAIRSRKKGWFASKNGARGWVVGPVICLWLSAFDRYGPMLFGRISRDNFGTKVSGRAGSDLNGLALYLFLLPLLAFFLYEMVATGEATTNQIVIIGALILFSPLMLWWSHKDRRQAEPLVRFLEDALSPTAKSRRVSAISVQLTQPFEMEVSGEKSTEPVTGDSIYEALLAMGTGDFIILASGAETYIQTLGQDAGLIIEKREGSGNQHYRAIRSGGMISSGSEGAAHFTFQEAWEVIAAYMSGSRMPAFLRWEQIAIGTDVYAAE